MSQGSQGWSSKRGRNYNDYDEYNQPSSKAQRTHQHQHQHQHQHRQYSSASSEAYHRDDHDPYQHRYRGTDSQPYHEDYLSRHSDRPASHHSYHQQPHHHHHRQRGYQTSYHEPLNDRDERHRRYQPQPHDSYTSISSSSSAASTSPSASSASSSTPPESEESIDTCLNPPLVITNVGQGINVIRDDVLVAGTKQRALYTYLQRLVLESNYRYREFVYAGPVYGFAQVALAYVGYRCNLRTTVFVAAQRNLHALTAKAKRFGCRIIEIAPPNYLAKVQEEAALYVEQDASRMLLPFGLSDERFISELASQITKAMATPTTERLANAAGTSADASNELLRQLCNGPKRIWVPCGSATILAALIRLFPRTHFLCVQVGKWISDKQLHTAHATIVNAPEPFDHVALRQPPYPSVCTYDAKLWQFVEQFGQEGDFVWNVGSDEHFLHANPPLSLQRMSLSSFDIQLAKEWLIHDVLQASRLGLRDNTPRQSIFQEQAPLDEMNLKALGSSIYEATRKHWPSDSRDLYSNRLLSLSLDCFLLHHFHAGSTTNEPDEEQPVPIRSFCQMFSNQAVFDTLARLFNHGQLDFAYASDLPTDSKRTAMEGARRFLASISWLQEGNQITATVNGSQLLSVADGLELPFYRISDLITHARRFEIRPTVHGIRPRDYWNRREALAKRLEAWFDSHEDQLDLFRLCNEFSSSCDVPSWKPQSVLLTISLVRYFGAKSLFDGELGLGERLMAVTLLNDEALSLAGCDRSNIAYQYPWLLGASSSKISIDQSFLKLESSSATEAYDLAIVSPLKADESGNWMPESNWQTNVLHPLVLSSWNRLRANGVLALPDEWIIAKEYAAQLAGDMPPQEMHVHVADSSGSTSTTRILYWHKQVQL